MIGAPACLLALALAASPARAQTPEERAESDRHFRTGVELYNEGRDGAALVEFRAAWDAAPHPQIAYNLGRVHDRLGHAVHAVEWYERFLATAGAETTRRVRAQVARDVERLRARIGSVRVEVDVEGATILVGSVDVASAPLAEPLRFDPGVVEIGARAPGYETQRRRIEVASGTEQTVRFELRPLEEPRGTLRVVSTLEDVKIRVDGNFVGNTPLPAPLSLPPGRHVISGERAGYVEDRQEIDVTEGVENRVRLRLDRDPDAPPEVLGRVRLSLPRAPTVVRIDGEPAIPEAGMLELPAGAHDLRIEVAERQPVQARIAVAAGRTVDVAPDFVWDADSRALRISESASRRAWGLGSMLAGGGLAIASAGLFVWSRARFNSDEAESRRAEIQRCVDSGMLCEDLPELVEADERLADETNVMGYIAMAGGAVGVITFAAGGWLYLGAPTEEEIDAHARARAPLRLRITPFGASLAGSF